MSTIQSSHPERRNAGLLVCVAAALLGIGLAMLGLAVLRLVKASPPLPIAREWLGPISLVSLLLGITVGARWRVKPAALLLILALATAISTPLIFTNLWAGLAGVTICGALAVAALSALPGSEAPLAQRYPLYFVLGVGGGILLCIAILRIAGAPSALFGAASLFAASAGCLGAFDSNHARVAGTALALLLVNLLTFSARGRLFELPPLQGEEIYVRWNHDSRVAVVRLPDQSLKLVIDNHISGPLARRDQVPTLTSEIAKALRPRARTLILGPGGGSEVRGALHAGSREITAVEANSIVARLVMQREHPEWTDHLFRQPEIQLINEDPLGYVRHTSERFQVIVLGETAPNSRALTKEFLTDCMLRLDPEGHLILPASTKEELGSAARKAGEALRELGEPEESLGIYGLRQQDSGQHYLLAFRKAPTQLQLDRMLQGLPASVYPAPRAPTEPARPGTSYGGAYLLPLLLLAASLKSWCSRWSLISSAALGFFAMLFAPRLYPYAGMPTTGLLVSIAAVLIAAGLVLRKPRSAENLTARTCFAFLSAGVAILLVCWWGTGPLVESGYGWPPPLRILSCLLLMLPGMYLLARLIPIPLEGEITKTVGEGFALRLVAVSVWATAAL